jgi:UPF0716 protein FxsA
VLFAVFLLVLLPVVELWVMVQVAGQIGAPETFLLLVALALGGVWLVKRQGLTVARRVREQLNRGELPAAEVIDGLLILAAGLLLLVPGFVTGAVGLLLLVPFVRRPLRSYALRRLQARVRVATVATGGVGARFAAYDITDVRSYERSEPDRRTVTPLELGPGPEGRAT